MVSPFLTNEWSNLAIVGYPKRFPFIKIYLATLKSIGLWFILKTGKQLSGTLTAPEHPSQLLKSQHFLYISPWFLFCSSSLTRWKPLCTLSMESAFLFYRKITNLKLLPNHEIQWQFLIMKLKFHSQLFLSVCDLKQVISSL